MNNVQSFNLVPGQVRALPAEQASFNFEEIKVVYSVGSLSISGNSCGVAHRAG